MIDLILYVTISKYDKMFVQRLCVSFQVELTKSSFNNC